MKHGWLTVPLGQVLQQRKEFVTIDDTHQYKRCRVQLHAKGIILRDVVDGVEIKTKEQQICRAGEFLVAEIDAKVGGFGVIPADLDGAIVSNHYFLFTIDDKHLERRFLDYFIRTPAFREQVNAQGTTNYAAIRPAQVLKYTIPIPSLPEQRRIVAKIEELAVKIDVANEMQRGTGLEVEALWDRSLTTIFEILLQNEHTAIFGDVCEVVRGGSPRPAGSPVYYDGPIPFLKVGDITKDSSKYISTYTSTIKEAGLSRSRLVEPGTLMLTNSGATLGVPKICTIRTCFNDGIQAFLNLSDELHKEYLYYFLLSKTGWFRAEAARGQGQPNLNTGMVKSLAFPQPSFDEQCRIITYLDDLQAKVDSLKALQAQSAAELDALLPSILDKAFKGEL